MFLKSQKSFTVIELLVVTAVVGLVVSIMAMAISGARAKARDAKRSAELDQIRKGLESYRIAEGGYPTTSDLISLEDTSSAEALKVRNALKPDYLSDIPKDPRWPQEYETGKKYSYQYIATSSDNYNLYAKREAGGYFKVTSENPTIVSTTESPGGAGGTGGEIGRFWVGGTGNWSDTSHWSESSGGAGGASLPTSGDNVYFDANSGTGTTTVDVTANCADLDFTGYTGTFAGSSALNIYGSLTMDSGMTRTYTGDISFAATTTGKTLTFNGVSISSSVTFDGVGGGWTLQDDLSVGRIYHKAGTLDINGRTVTTTGVNYSGCFRSFGTTPRTLILGAATINIGSAYSYFWLEGSNLTFDAGSSTINMLSGGSQRSLKGAGYTFNNVVFKCTSSVNDILGTGTTTFANLTYDCSGMPVKISYSRLESNIIVTGKLTINGNSASNRLLLKSSEVGTARTITAATVSASNVDFQDITGAGDADWDLSAITGGSGDCGGNTNIVFTPAQTNYWVGGTGNWSDASEWASSSGGEAGTGRVPLPQDDVRFDANSFSTTSQTVTADMYRLGKNIDWTGVTNTPTLSTPGQYPGIYIFGSLTLVSGMKTYISANTYFYGRDDNTITMGGKNIGGYVQMNMVGGSLTLQDNFSCSNYLHLVSGTFNANNFDVVAGWFGSSNSNVRALMMGSGTWYIRDNWYMANVSNLTFDAGTSTIKLTQEWAHNVFYGGGEAYYNFWNAKTGEGTVSMYGSNTFNDFKIDAGRTMEFAGGTTQTVKTFTANGDSDNLIVLRSTSSSNRWNLVVSETSSVSYVDVKDSKATGDGTPIDDSVGGVDSGNNTGWTF